MRSKFVNSVTEEDTDLKYALPAKEPDRLSKTATIARQKA